MKVLSNKKMKHKNTPINIKKYTVIKSVQAKLCIKHVIKGHC